MEPRILLLLPFAWLMAGCVHTHEVGYDTSYGHSEVSPEKILVSFQREYVTAVLEHEEPLEGTVLSMSADTLQLQPEGSDSCLHIPIRQIETIEVGGDPLGPILGFLGGGIVGGIVGRAASSGEHSLILGEGTIGAVAGGVTGGLVGLFAGSQLTATNRYVLSRGVSRSDSVRIRVPKILSQTSLSVIIPWNGGEVILPKWRIEMEERTDGVYVSVPRTLLFDQYGRPKRVVRQD